MVVPVYSVLVSSSNWGRALVNTKVVSEDFTGTISLFWHAAKDNAIAAKHVKDLIVFMICCVLNFTKFIVDREGIVRARFEPTADMARVEKFVKGLL